MQKEFIWDSYSDQPYPIVDREFKKRLRRKNLFQKVKTHLLTPFLLPFYIHSKLFYRGRKVDLSRFFGMGVSIEKGEKQIELIERLGVEDLLIRFPLWEIENIDRYIQFVGEFKSRSVLLNILQHRDYLTELEEKFRTIFREFSRVGVKEFQIGNAINRTKWGFFSVDEYLKFYQTAYRVKREFPDIKLAGSSVIDFEFENFIGTHYNSYDINYDITSSLLYVDRRGKPENRQYGVFNLKSKIELLNSIVKFSKKSEKRVYVTETNWPLLGTAPYTPTSQKEAVSFQDYTDYSIRYLLIAIATGGVERVYWHQLIAHGYGLVDKDGEPYPQYRAFQNILSLLKDEELQSYSFKAIYELIFKKVTVYWSPEREYKLNFKEEREVIDIFGERSRSKEVTVNGSPIYLLN